MTITVVVADDQALVRGGFSVLLRSAPDIDVVGEAGDGAEAVEVALRERPDVVLMDIRMPVFDGIEATRRIISDPRTAATKILIVTTFDLDEYVYDGLRAGASGFLLKDTRPDTLLDAVRVVAAGEALLAPQITRRLIEEFTTRPAPTAPADIARGPHRAGARSAGARRPRALERRDRRDPLHEPGDEQDARVPSADEARRPRQGPARHARLRGRSGDARNRLIRGERSSTRPRARTDRVSLRT